MAALTEVNISWLLLVLPTSRPRDARTERSTATCESVLASGRRCWTPSRRSSELLGQVGVFVRVIRCDERGELIALVVCKRPGDRIERIVPRHFVAEGSWLIDTGIAQSIGGLLGLVAPFALFTEVAMIRAALPQVRGAAHDALAGFDVDRATDVAESADCFGGVEIPGMTGEMTVGQRAHRANRDAHAAVRAEGVLQFETECRADRSFDTSMGRFDCGNTDDFVAHARAAVAHDAAIELVVDRVAEMHIGLREFRPPIGVRVEIAEVGVVLQIAFARFVTGRTVERMIDQVHLQNELARVFGRFGVGENFHALAERRCARFDEAATFAENLDRADAAGSPGAQQWLIAEVGYLDIRHACGLEDCGPSGNGHI